MSDSNLSDITNIVVLMFENRSFDNIFGNLYATDYKANGCQFDGVEVNNSPGTSSPWTEVLANGQPDWSDEVITCPNPDPGERFQNVNMQLFGTTFPFGSNPPQATPDMVGFASDYTLQKPTGEIHSGNITWPKLPRTRYWSPVNNPGVGADAVGSDIMHYFSPQQLPVSSQLAQQYAVCDQWFCSVPTQTYPNRMFSLCATTWAKPLLGDYKEYIDDYDMILLHSRVNSIFQELDHQLGTAKNNWKIYSNSYSISQALVYYVHEHSDQVVSYLSDFQNDVESDSLAPFTLIEPRYDAGNDRLKNNPNSYHPPYSVLEGEQFLQEVYETLFSSNNPSADTTLLIVTFDEHGGTYDHVAPPAAPLPSAVRYSSNGKDIPENPSGPPFNRYGVRVPSILISSQIAPGSIFRQTATNEGEPTAYLDHTSIIRTVFDWQFPGQKISLTNRDQCAPSVSAVLTEAVGSNPGVDFSKIKWPLPIHYSDDEKKALEEQNHLAEMRKGAEL